MRNHIYTIICLLSIFIYSGCSTEEYAPIVGSIEGIVINEKTKEPIERCQVTNPQLGATLTDSNGRYSFTDVTPGNFQLTYSCNQFQTATQEFVVSAGKTVQANVSLSPAEGESILQPNSRMLDFGNRNGVIDLILKNTTDKAVSYSIICDATEVNFEPMKGTVASGNSVIVKVAVDRTELSEGHYECTASIITESTPIDLHIIFDKGSATRPKVTTLALEQGDNHNNSIVAKGNIVSVGSSNIIQHGFCYSFDVQPSLTNNDGVINRGSAATLTEFSSTISNLEYEKAYYVCAFATNKEGTSYGEPLSIVLARQANGNPDVPNPDVTTTESYSLSTGQASNVKEKEATFNGRIDVNGSAKLKEYGFYYGTSSNPTIRVVAKSFNSPTAVTTNDVSAIVKDLAENTTYYYQLYVIDKDNKIIKGNVVQFTTKTTPTIVINYLNVSESLGLTGKATLYPQGNTMLEAGFIYRTDGYDLTLSSNYNGMTVKVPCEIISNTISLNKDNIGGYLGGGYVRAYMILVDGTIIYNGPKIYVAKDLPYPRNK